MDQGRIRGNGLPGIQGRVYESVSPEQVFQPSVEERSLIWLGATWAQFLSDLYKRSRFAKDGSPETAPLLFATEINGHCATWAKE